MAHVKKLEHDSHQKLDYYCQKSQSDTLHIKSCPYFNNAIILFRRLKPVLTLFNRESNRIFGGPGPGNLWIFNAAKPELSMA